MSKGESWSSEAYSEKRRETVSSGVAVTHVAERQSRSGYGLDPAVDPKTHGATRESTDTLVKQPNGSYLLSHGIALPVKTDSDLTGSMGHNIDEIFKLLPRTQKLLVGPGALLERYDVHFATGGIQDQGDKHPYMTTEFERDNLIDAQMAKLVPEREGGDATEDYQLALFFMGQRIKASIRRHGLKGYYFIVGDEIGRDSLTPSLAKQVFGLDIQKTPTEDLVKKVLAEWHVFFLQVNSISWTTEWWGKLLGSDRVVSLPTIAMLAEVQACIIGLTEGKLELQSLDKYLTKTAGVSKAAAELITNAVSRIPTRAQCTLPSFDRIPLAGATVKDPEDLYPDTGASVVAQSPGNASGEINLDL